MRALTSSWKGLLILFLPAVVVAAFSVWINVVDPLEVTRETISAEIVSRVNATGKTGARTEITVRTSNGAEYHFQVRPSYRGHRGDEATLRVYKRRITGLTRYELE